MVTPTSEFPRYDFDEKRTNSSDDDGTVFGQQDAQEKNSSVDSRALHTRLQVETSRLDAQRAQNSRPSPSPSQTREESSRLDDEMALMKAEKIVSQQQQQEPEGPVFDMRRSRSRAEPVDDFDIATNPVHQRTQVYHPPENPSTKVAQFLKRIHESSFVVRYFTYIVPVTILLLTPILVARYLPSAQNANVGGVKLLWFGVWLEIFWLTLWAGRILMRMLPFPFGLVSSVFTNNSKKWRDLAKQLEVPGTLFFWWLGIEISFLPCMKNHHIDGDKATKPWEKTVNKIIIAIFVGVCLNFAEKIIIQLIAISFHLRTYADRIDINKFQIGSLTKLYIFSKAKIAMEDAEFEEKDQGVPSGARTPAVYVERANQVVNKAFMKVGDVAGTVAGDFTGKAVAKSGHPSQVILALLNSTGGSQVLARRLYRTFVREGLETVFSDDLKPAFENEDEADAAFTMFDKDLNGDISMEELESVCVEIGRERKSITASLKDLDSVVGKLDNVLLFVVVAVTILVFISLISTSAAGVLTSAGSAVLALSWLFSATAQEFLQSCIFVFVKHPFDVGDRVSIYGNTGSTLKGDDYFVKEISLLYTEFKKMEGQIVQAPNSYLNTLFIMNMRRSGGLAEAVPIVIRFGTSLEQIEGLRNQLLEFVSNEKREYQNKILTELRDVTEAYSLTLNIVFFYKSNWQNELLRLQRRNKFICAMMVTMQDLGIEGPRRNNAGWRTEIPMYMQWPAGAPPGYSTAPNSNEGGPQAPASTANEQQTVVPSSLSHPSIMRTSASPFTRQRSESASNMSKHVDFSLGMKGLASGEELSNVYEDTKARSRLRSVVEETNAIEDARRAEERAQNTSSPSRARKSNDSNDPAMHGGLFRRSTSQSLRNRNDSVSSTATHRNRFLNRMGHTGRSMEVPREALAEEGNAGPIDLRSGVVSNEAYRLNSTNSIQPDIPIRPIGSKEQDFAVLQKTENHKP